MLSERSNFGKVRSNEKVYLKFFIGMLSDRTFPKLFRDTRPTGRVTAFYSSTSSFLLNPIFLRGTGGGSSNCFR
jgi:hypothetical protein